MELSLARLLRVGSLLAAFFIASGLLMMFSGDHRIAGNLITTGLLILLATPILRVIVAGVIFARDGDWRFAIFCLIVLCSIVAGVLLGRLHTG